VRLPVSLRSFRPIGTGNRDRCHPVLAREELVRASPRSLRGDSLGTWVPAGGRQLHELGTLT